jgi:hypothetical protein
MATADAAKFSAAERDELMAATNRLQHRLTMAAPSGPLHRRPDPCLTLDPVAERLP